MSPPKPTNVMAIDPHGLFDSRPNFSHVASSAAGSRVVMTAGQVGADDKGVAPRDTVEQIQLAFYNLRRCLESFGASVTDIVKLVFYIVDYDHTRRQHTTPLQSFLQGHRPATTLVPVPKLAKPEFKFEVEAYVSLPQQPLQEVDVVVVGAGLSGLKAAYDIQQSGHTCAVVEARDRVGGKTWSSDRTDAGKFVDLGAAWINDTNQSEIFRLVQTLGLETVEQNTTGSVIQEDTDGTISQFQYGGLPQRLVEANGVANVTMLRDRAEEVCQTLDIRSPAQAGSHLDNLTFEDWVRSVTGSSESAMASARIWTRVMLGLEPHEMSALFFLNYCKSGGGLIQTRSDQKEGGQYLRLVKGTQSISIGLASLLQPGTITLNSPVRSIEQTQSAVHVTSTRRQYICKRVVVSVPTPLYKEITFTPQLPADKVELSQRNKLGYNNKVIVRYSSPWWRNYGLSGMLQSFAGPVCVTRDTSIERLGQFSLSCFCVGDWGRQLSKLSQEKRFETVITHIEKTLGSVSAGKVPLPVGIEEHEWQLDQWAQGCPCPASSPGATVRLERALRSTHGKVHFVGTETAYEWKGYMDGAVRSGARGADEVVTALNAAKL
ncbi:Monoamine oxidase [Purpureocillium takamizusanense]|uniref:Amine oxidase n=1 Tax=Purpureocillium takamizusanense TaxID=2060973 RepID=A0A9Q8QGF7_9HYPO|nr:Monoamine oxidase [Purpureocillium takamizusanense]UNI18406.1 Monoamine oxidase [Purpureocillium takamizusanense]